MIFLKKLDNLISEKKITRNKMLKDLSLGTNSFVNWQERNTIPSGETLSKIADYFNVSVDYLLGKTNNPAPPDSDITFDDFTFAFYEESKTLTEEDKENLLDMARIFNQRRKERQRKDGE
ncbi:MAG: helix-turn-helix domain-containing protein [Firmicutes bacterium]|nr:helix-turn-helix domain-containing protein [Bacillota bacterium]